MACTKSGAVSSSHFAESLGCATAGTTDETKTTTKYTANFFTAGMMPPRIVKQAILSDKLVGASRVRMSGQFSAVAAQTAQLFRRTRWRVLIRLDSGLRANSRSLGKKVVQRLQPQHLGLKHATEVTRRRGRDFFEIQHFLQLALHRGDGLAGQAAGHDQGKRVEVGGHIQRKAVRSHRARDMHPYRRDFGLRLIAQGVGPDTRKSLDPLRADPKVSAGAYQNFFEAPDVLHRAYLRLETAQIDNWISHQLAWPVKRHV